MPEEPTNDHSGDDGERPAGQGRLEVWLDPFFSDPALRPLLIVATAITVTIGASVVLLAVRSRNLAALAAFAILVVISGDVVQRDLRARGFGRASRVVVGLWLLIALATGAALASGIF